MLANMLSKNIFQGGAGRQSFDAVTDLQKLLEADVYKFNPDTQAFDFVKNPQYYNIKVTDIDLVRDAVSEILQIDSNEQGQYQGEY